MLVWRVIFGYSCPTRAKLTPTRSTAAALGFTPSRIIVWVRWLLEKSGRMYMRREPARACEAASEQCGELTYLFVRQLAPEIIREFFAADGHVGRVAARGPGTPPKWLAFERPRWPGRDSPRAEQAGDDQRGPLSVRGHDGLVRPSYRPLVVHV